MIVAILKHTSSVGNVDKVYRKGPIPGKQLMLAMKKRTVLCPNTKVAETVALSHDMI